MSERACTASRFGDHDYSCPPHTTPEEPRDADDEGSCQAQSAHAVPCEHERAYELVIFQIGSHEWIRMFACTPCTAELRQRHARLGPRGTQGIARVRTAAQEPCADPA